MHMCFTALNMRWHCDCSRAGSVADFKLLLSRFLAVFVLERAWAGDGRRRRPTVRLQLRGNEEVQDRRRLLLSVRHVLGHFRGRHRRVVRARADGPRVGAVGGPGRGTSLWATRS